MPKGPNGPKRKAAVAISALVLAGCTTSHQPNYKFAGEWRNSGNTTLCQRYPSSMIIRLIDGGEPVVNGRAVNFSKNLQSSYEIPAGFADLRLNNSSEILAFPHRNTSPVADSCLFVKAG